MIRKEGNKWILFSHDGKKHLGEFDSKEAAEKRERQINFFKAVTSHPEIANKIKREAK
jgi:hypothetical protein